MLSLESVVSAAPDQVSCDLEGEAVILNLGSGVYYGLNEVGAWIWARIQQPCKVAEIRDAMLAEFDVDAERCERDLLALLGQMADEGIIQIDNRSDD